MYKALADELYQANRTGKLPDNVALKAEQILQFLKKEEVFWFENKKYDPRDDFAMYHASRNSRLVAQRLMKRLSVAPSTGDNPKVADDALEILPILDSIYNIVSIHSKPTFEEKRKIHSLVFDLRREAAKHDLKPTEEEELEGISEEDLKRHSVTLAKTIDKSLSLSKSNS